MDTKSHQRKTTEGEVVDLLKESWDNRIDTMKVIANQSYKKEHSVLLLESGTSLLTLDLVTYQTPRQGFSAWKKEQKDAKEKRLSLATPEMFVRNRFTLASCYAFVSKHPTYINMCEGMDLAECRSKYESSVKTGDYPLLNPDSCELLIENLIKCDSIKFFYESEDLEVIDLSNVLALLLPFDFVKLMFYSYPLVADSNVRILQGQEEQTEYMDYRDSDDSVPFRGDTDIWTNEELKGLGYIVLLMMIKPKGSEGRTTTAFLTARLGALASSMGSEMRIQKMIEAFSMEELNDLQQKMSFFPNFKAQVYRAIFMGSGEASDHIKMILKEANMTMFAMMYKFVVAHPTALHFNARVMREIAQFIEIVGLLKGIYGEAIGYFKLINPTSQMTSATKFLALGEAALSWTSVDDPSSQASLEKLKGRSKVNARYIELAKKRLGNEYVKNESAGTLNILRNMRESTYSDILNINWDRVIDDMEDGKEIFTNAENYV